MGAVAAELQSLGHRPNFFYLQHAMGLASSMGLGIALSKPERQVVVFDGDGSILMNLGGLTTLARYRPRNLVHVVFDNESLLSVGGFPTATATGSDLAGIAAAAGIPRTATVTTLDEFTRAFDEALAAGDLTTIVAKVEAVGPSAYVTDLSLLENRFQFARYLQIMSAAPLDQLDRRARRAASLAIVDLTQPLGPATPVIGLPPIFAPSPGVTIDVISHYDDARAGLVLEHAAVRRAHRHALRRAGALDHRQGSAGERLRHDSGAALRRSGVRDRRHRATSRPTPTSC